MTLASGTAIGALTGYRIYYGQTSGSYPSSVLIAGGTSSAGTITGLAPGVWYFTVTAIDAQGNESSVGYEVSKSL